MRQSTSRAPDRADANVPEIIIPERIEAPAGGNLEGCESDLPGLAVLENSDRGITIAAHAGERYTKATEAASVRLELDHTGETPVARIVEFAEAGFARGSQARRDALAQAEYLASQKGVELIHFKVSETKFERLPLPERENIISTLQDEGFLVRYFTRMPDGERRLMPQPGQPIEKQTIAGEPLSVDAVKNLASDRPQRPEKELYFHDVHGERLEAELIESVEQGHPPEEIHLPPKTSDKLGDLWEKSVKKERLSRSPVREYGALLVKDDSGRMTLSHVVKGNEDSVQLETLDNDEILIGDAHTHPYRSGLTDMSFSGGDFASFVSDGSARISIVRSGDTVFASVKTDATPVIDDDARRTAITNEINSNYECYLRELARQRPGAQPTFADLQNAALAANLDACAEYDLGLYQGKAGQPLKRVFP